MVTTCLTSDDVCLMMLARQGRQPKLRFCLKMRIFRLIAQQPQPLHLLLVLLSISVLSCTKKSSMDFGHERRVWHVAWRLSYHLIEIGGLGINLLSLGIIFLELRHPFSTGMERHVVLSDLKKKGELPSDWAAEFPDQALLLRRMMSLSPSDRPSATELLKRAFLPRMESELLDNILRTMHNSKDTSIYDKVVDAVFSEEIINTKNQDNEFEVPKLGAKEISSIQHTDLDTEIRDLVWEVSSTVFRLHCAKHL